MARKLSEMSGAERVAWLRQQRQKRSIGLDTFEDDLKALPLNTPWLFPRCIRIC